MSSALQFFMNGCTGSDFPYEGDFYIDAAILATFPRGTTVVSASRFGSSAWTVTARVVMQFLDGSQDTYFLKSAVEAHGRSMMEGEFNSMTELYRWAPYLVPKPHAWGKYRNSSIEAYFFIAQFIDMVDQMPNPKRLCQNLARLHSESESPTGCFGFHITTCQGRAPQDARWQKSWTVFFTQLLGHVVRLDSIENGVWEDLVTAFKRLESHVIPRLLDALVANGRTIKPCLIHGDLWEGNIGTSLHDGKLYIFDAAAYYAHNEMEVADWRCFYNQISNKAYTREYLRLVDPSEPQAEWEDRNRLYSIYYNVIYSVNHRSEGQAIRQLAYSDMLHLIRKHAPFPAGTGPRELEQSQLVSLPDSKDHTAVAI